MAGGELSHRIDSPARPGHAEAAPNDTDDLFRERPGGVVELVIDRLYSDERRDDRYALKEASRDAGHRLYDRMSPERWREAEPGERTRFAHEAHAHIREAYGLKPNELSVSSTLGDEVLGEFDPGDGRVSVNESLLSADDPKELIDTIAHENEHALQDEIVEGRKQHPLGDLGKAEVELWRDGDRAYDPIDLVGKGYGYNPLEVDANNAARHVIDGYNEAREAERESLTARIASLEEQVENQAGVIAAQAARIEALEAEQSRRPA
jgi:hypothetical protein